MASSKKGSAGVVWTKNTLSLGLGVFSEELNAKVAVLVDRQADVGTRMMKQGAPWTDRTGNARATLMGTPKHSEREHQIILSGGMPYQIWLEIKQAGKYAIIGPTVPELGRKTMAMFEGLLAMMRG